MKFRSFSQGEQGQAIAQKDSAFLCDGARLTAFETL